MGRGFEIIEDGRAPRLVHLARRQGGGPAAQQLAFDIWIVGMEAGSEDQSVLLPLFLSGTAGPELAEPGGGEGDAGCDESLVQARSRGVPAGCGGHARRGSEADGQSGAASDGQ